MTNVMKSLWNKDLGFTNRFFEESVELKKTEELMEKNLKVLRDCAGGPARDRLERYVDCVNEYLYLYGQQTFCDGFALGGKMMMEVFLNTEK